MASGAKSDSSSLSGGTQFLKRGLLALGRQTLLFLFILALLLAGCQARPAVPALPGWEYQDVKLLDPVDAAQPAQDITAAYLQPAGHELDLRVDLLDQDLTPAVDLYLALDYTTGGKDDLPIQAMAGLPWDSLVCIPAHGSLQVLDTAWHPQAGWALRVLRDAEQDELSIRLRLAPQAQRRLSVQIFSTAPGSPALADQTHVFRLQDPPPPPANVLFAFWDVYPAYTPATALRRWSGAHTGPLGGSHGLGQLLRNAEQAGIPLALLDLKTPFALAALDMMGEMPRIQRMLQADQLILPELLPGAQPAPSTPSFGLANSRFAFGPAGSLPAGQPGYALARWSGLSQPAATLTPRETRPFVRTANPTWLALPVGAALPTAVDPGGVTLQMRQALSAIAQPAKRGGAPSVLLLGGSLPESTWGAPLQARLGFRYIQRHPWIQVLDAGGLAAQVRAGAVLQTAPPARGRAAENDPAAVSTTAGAQTPSRVGNSLYQPALPEAEEQALRAALAQAPANPLRQAAWEAYTALYAPVYPVSAQLPALRASYISQVWALLAAAAWAEKPSTQLTCQADIDRDGSPDCLLADQSIYLQFSREGTLQYAFIRQEQPGGPAVHQWIGPSSQLITGLSDPATWQVQAGLSADPQVIPGASYQPGQYYPPGRTTIEVLTGQPLGLVFDSLEAQKSFTWDSRLLQVSYRVKTPGAAGKVRIPLLLDPWERFSPGWARRYAFQAEAGGQAITGQLQGSMQVRIHGQGLKVISFLDALPALSRPEDPDQDYPAGHYLPFPLALVEAPVQGRLELQIEFP